MNLAQVDSWSWVIP